MIAAKVEGRQTVETPAPQHLAPVIDIMEALKASLAQAKPRLEQNGSHSLHGSAMPRICSYRGQNDKRNKTPPHSLGDVPSN